MISDSYEDQGNLPLATTLRWLHRWDHWPMKTESGKYIWFFANSYAASGLVFCRYAPPSDFRLSSGESYKREVDFLRASLPPEFYPIHRSYTLSRSSLPNAIRLFVSLFRRVGPITPTVYAPGTE